ncbi:MAG: isopentenyl-diphosphate delta-isomerase [Hyphomicrobiales bacterium]|nr:isopentenyl-diphosphate delta-isomerase [Hyphomicrobiales bacterium]
MTQAEATNDGEPRPTTREVVLLDAQDKPVGAIGKHAAHMRGLYHAAISIVLVDRTGRQLLQQRAWTKYHCGGMWSNACCSHQMAGESSHAAARRRLYDELRLRTPLVPLARVRYRARVGHLTEHECVDLFVGLLDEAPRFNPREVAQVAWLSPGDPHAHDPLTPWSTLYLKLFGFDAPLRRAMGLDDGAVRDCGPLVQL